jgi:hypothetical protein
MASLPGSAPLLRALVAASCFFPLIGACGGRSDTEDYLFGSDGTISVGASSNSGAGRGSTSGGTRAGGGSNGTAGRGTITAGSGPITMGGSVSVGGGGPIPEAGEPSVGGSAVAGSSFGGAVSMGGVGVAGTGTAGTGGKPVVVPISCGNQTCDSSTQVCCAGLGGFGCLAKNKMCNGAVLSCTSNDDCAGNQVCCVALTGDVADASSCKGRCDNMGAGRDRQLCDVDADCLAPFRFCTATIFGINICTRRP